MGLTKVAFTICSNNYLAQAKTLGDSFVEHNPEYKFIICLVDEFAQDIDYDFFLPHEVVLSREIGIKDFETLIEKYNIIELNTAVKASFFKYIFKRFNSLNQTYYFDPDLMFFSSIAKLDKEFEQANILLTPHINTPIPIDESSPNENSFLNYGIYNLGFIGVKRDKSSFEFLDWWEERTLKLGFSNVKKGYFVDQLWINLVPLFFPKVRILKEYGYNAAPWNLHERKHIKKADDDFIMEDRSKLVFYHFSSYDFKSPDKISKHYHRYTFENCPDLKELYHIYYNIILKNQIDKFSAIPCAYFNKEEPYQNKNRFEGKRLLKLIIPPIVFKLLNGKRNFSSN